MNRRDAIAFVAVAVALQPFAAATRAMAQGARRLAIIMAVTANAPEYAEARSAFRKDLERLGWKEGANLIVDERWGVGDEQRAQSTAAEIASLKPDVVLGQSTVVIDALKSTTKTIPIVFIHVADPLASRLVASLAHPGANITGITNIEPSIGGKWLQFLKEAAPHWRAQQCWSIPPPNRTAAQFSCVRSQMRPARLESRR